MTVYSVMMVRCDAEGCGASARLMDDRPEWFAVGERSYCPIHAAGARAEYEKRKRAGGKKRAKVEEQTGATV